MKKILALLLAFVSFSLVSQEFDKQKLNKYIKILEEKDQANLSVAISKGNKVIYINQGGYLTAATQKKTDQSTKFRIGSITKTFTATVIFQLIEEGKLSLSDKLSKFFPKVVNADKITVEHLLGHRSGIHNYTAVPDFALYLTKEMSLNDMQEKLEQMTSDFEPGTKTSYSNSGYFLLGMIIEKVTNTSYQKNVDNRIVKKLQLTNTYYGGKIDNSNNEANSQLFNKNWVDFPSEWNMSVAYSAGAMVSTPQDLNHFMYSLFNHQLVSKNSVDKMREIIGGLGHGVFSIPFGNRTAFGHNGRIDSFDSGSYYFPEDDINVTLLCNGVRVAYNDILVGILSIYFNTPFEMPTYDEKAITLETSLLSNYEGVFSSKSLPIKITIKVDGDELTAQATGQGAFPLTPFSNRDFRFDPSGVIILYGESNGKTDYSTFVLKQAGQQFTFKKD